VPLKRSSKKLKKKALNLFNAKVATITWRDRIRLFFVPMQVGRHEGHEVRFKVDRDGKIYVLGMRRVA
jgi:hypothetical protein